MIKNVEQHIKDIKIVDNFFPKIVERQIYSHILKADNEWLYQPTVSFPNSRNKNYSLLSMWKKNNKIQDGEAFILPIKNDGSGDTEFKNFLYSNILLSAQNKFNMTGFQIGRCMFTYLPPDPDYQDDHFMPPHVDFEFSHKNILFYIDDNDAETNFYDLYHDSSNFHNFPKLTKLYGVTPKQGRAIMFDGGIYHSGSVSKFKRRITLNISLIADSTKNNDYTQFA